MQAINNALLAARVLRHAEWTAIASTLGQFIEDFKNKIEQYRHISSEDFHICLLMRYGVKGKDIAILMAQSPSSISKKITSLRLRFLGEGAKNKDFESFIHSIQ